MERKSGRHEQLQQAVRMDAAASGFTEAVNVFFKPRLSGSEATWEKEQALIGVHWLRPEIPLLLSSDDHMPAMLDVLTRLGRAQMPGDKKMTNEAQYAASQMVSLNFDAIRVIGERQDELGEQALLLLYDSAFHMFLEESLPFLTTNLSRAVRIEMANRHEGSTWERYARLAEQLLHYAKPEQMGGVADAIDGLVTSEDTQEVGLVMQKRAAEVYLPDDSLAIEGKADQSILIAFYARIQKELRLVEFRERSSLSAELMQQAEQLGLADELWGMAMETISQRRSFKCLSEELACRTVEHYGLNFTELRAAWEVGSSGRLSDEYSFDDYIRDNLRIIRWLETAAPTSASVLSEEFGIRNFSRYPSGVLLEQYNQRDNKHIPYGALICSLENHNRALEGYWLAPKILQLAAAANMSGCHVRIYECDSGESVARALLDARYRYSRKLAFAAGVVHGHAGGLCFKNAMREADITTQDILRVLKGKSGSRRRLASLFAVGATGVLASCNTGVGGGIAEVVSELLSIPVTAPTATTALEGLHATALQDGLQLEVVFSEDVARTIHSK